MSYPQPNPDLSVQTGQKIFRLRTQTISPGDTYDSVQSGFAFAIGPDSDIANVAIYYYDDALKPTFMNQAAISPGAPFIGEIDVRNEAVYQPSGIPGRIIFSLLDVLPLAIPPAQSVWTAGLGTIIIPPILDIVQYLTPPPGNIPSVRNDRNYFFSFPKLVPNFPIILRVPYYGRTFADVSFNGTGDLTIHAINGLKFGPGLGNGLNPDSITPLLTTTNPATDPYPFQVNSKPNGMFDYLEFQIQSKGPGNTSTEVYITLSDTPR